MTASTLQHAAAAPPAPALAAPLPRVALRLHPDAGHAFPFPDQATVVPAVDRFLR